MTDRKCRTDTSLKKPLLLLIQGALCLTLNNSIALAGSLDFFGEPPLGDPSAFTGPFIGLDFARATLAQLPPANAGAFAGALPEPSRTRGPITPCPRIS